MDIAIIATSGRNIRRLGWITAGTGGIYFGFQNHFWKDNHYSYHSNGCYYHTRGNAKAELLGTGQPLTGFKGAHLLHQYTGDVKSLDRNFFSPFSLKQKDDGVYIDASSLGERFLLGIALTEPYNPDAFQLCDKEGLTRIHIITEYKPWIVVGYGSAP